VIEHVVNGPRMFVEVSNVLTADAPAAVVRMANRTVVLVRVGMTWVAALALLAVILTAGEHSALRAAVAAHHGSNFANVVVEDFQMPMSRATSQAIEEAGHVRRPSSGNRA